MLNKDLIETFERNIESDSNSLNDLTVNNTGVNNNLESNIENGNASLDLNSGSLTNVSKSTLTDNTNSSSIINDKTSQKETTKFISKGNIGITSSAELLEKWRKVLINIDELIINECSDLFIMIY